MSDGNVRNWILALATGGVNQLPARILDHNMLSTSGQGGDQTGSIMRAEAGTTTTARVTISQFFNPGFFI